MYYVNNDITALEYVCSYCHRWLPFVIAKELTVSYKYKKFQGRGDKNKITLNSRVDVLTALSKCNYAMDFRVSSGKTSAN